MTGFRRLLIAARPRHWVLSAADLHALGLTRHAIGHAVAVGVLHPVHREVYAVGRPELAPSGQWRAATLAVPGSALCLFSAAACWGLTGGGAGPVHVAVGSQGGRGRRSGLVVHRCDRLTPDAVTIRNGIRVTTLQRTLRDLAGPLDAQAMTRVLRQAERLHRVDLGRTLRAMGPARPGANRENRLRRVIEQYVPGEVRVGLEDEALGVLHERAVPTPATQHPIGPYFADFAWPDVRLVVEVDDRASHDTWTQAQEDRARDRYMVAHGWEVLRFTWADVTRRPDQMAAEVRAALVRRRTMPVTTATTRL